MIKIINIEGFIIAAAIGKERKGEYYKLRGGRFNYGFYDNKCSEETLLEMTYRCEKLIFVEDRSVKKALKNEKMEGLLVLLKEGKGDE
jgi:hypothetical protein